MRKFSNKKNIHAIFILSLLVVMLYLSNLSLINDETRLYSLNEAYQNTASEIENFDKSRIPILGEKSDSEILCSAFRQTNVEQVNCFTGDIISDNFQHHGIKKYLDYISSLLSSSKNQKLSDKSYQEIWNNIYQDKREKLEFLVFLRNHLIESSDRSEQQQTLALLIDQRVNNLQKRFKDLEDNLFHNETQREQQYRNLFLISLELDGMLYSQVSGEFKKVSWGIGTILRQGGELEETHRTISILKNYLPLIIIVPLMFIVYFYLEHQSKTLLVYLTSLCFFVCVSLYITLDAAINFGFTSSQFIISPFIDIFKRQVLVTLVGYTVLFASIFYLDYFKIVLQRMHQHQRKLVFFGILFGFAGYASFSAAVGSEIMKIFIVLFSAFMTSRHAREIFLIQKYCSSTFSMTKLKEFLFWKKYSNENIMTSDFLMGHIYRAFFYFLLITFSLIFFSLFIFNDIGGVFITFVLIMILVSIVFGLRFFFFWFLILVVLGYFASFTEKVRERVTLMMEPMNAPVSDFARLINFSNSDEDGLLVGYSWCNDYGVCVPLQVLSDYMPLVIEKIFGFYGAIIFLLILVGFFAFIAAKTFYIFLTGEKENRLLSIFLFYISCSSIIQIILSTFGNWRLIPLSGISIPFTSIGFTAIIIPCLTYGLFIGLTMRINKRGSIHDL